MKRCTVLLLVLLLAGSFCLFAAGQAESSELPRFVEIGTAGTGGAYYPIGIAMAEVVNVNLATQATAQVTGGAVDNIRLIQDGSVKIALTTTSSAYKGLNGIDPFPTKSDRVAGMFGNLTQGVYQIAVREGSGIKSVKDLVGKRVSLGPQGNLGVEMSDYVFKAAGFSINDVRATFLSYDEGVTMMADGNLDAVIIQTALPNPALRQLEATGGKVHLISLPEDVIEKVVTDHPYFARFVIPKSMYGSAADIVTLNSTNMAIVDSRLSDDVVYALTKAMLDNIDAIRTSHPAASAFNLEEASQVPIPLHPGAERFFREKGIL